MSGLVPGQIFGPRSVVAGSRGVRGVAKEPPWDGAVLRRGSLGSEAEVVGRVDPVSSHKFAREPVASRRDGAGLEARKPNHAHGEEAPPLSVVYGAALYCARPSSKSRDARVEREFWR